MENNTHNSVEEKTVTHSTTTSLTAEQQAFINKFSLGGFFIPQIHFFATNLIRDGFLLLVPFYNIYVWLRGAFKGRSRSWETGEWKSFESFQRRQKTMDKAALIILAVVIAYFVVVFLFVMAVGSMMSAGSRMERMQDDKQYQNMEELQDRIRMESERYETRSF